MTDIFPISCISCRRKKIKCNKTKPCNQCVKRHIGCSFPKTFRNIKINENELANSMSLNSISESNEEEHDKDYDRRYIALTKEANNLKNEHTAIAEEHTRLKMKYQELVAQISAHQRARNIGESLDSSKNDLSRINGETSEFGERYYGPQSSNHMIKALEKSKVYESLESGVTEANPQRNSFNNQLNFEELSCQDNSDTTSHSLVEKKLPYLLDVDEVTGSKRISIFDLEKLNFHIIKRLVDLFFTYHSIYAAFISKSQIVNFLNYYEASKNYDWEDDVLLLLTMILLLLIQRLTAIEFIEINLIENKEDQINRFKQIKNYLTEKLFRQYETIRHNLINEAITTIQSYILCTEWHFIEQRYEECWSMMFHACSISYSIGLHVVGKFGFMNEQCQEEREKEFNRCKVWFALRNISSQICSVLGRPNPISLNIGSMLLEKSNIFPSKLKLNKRCIFIALKISLSECLELSNMMLIENFTSDFNIKDLLDVDTKFKNGIALLERFVDDSLYDHDFFLGDNSQDSVSNNIKDNDNYLKFTVDKTNLLIDLITFYINRAKLLFQPFIVKYEDPKYSSTIIELLQSSLIKFLALIRDFIDSFLQEFEIKYKDFQFKFLKVEIFDKLLRLYFPFLNSFIYQGMLLIFTFLCYKFKEIVEYEELDNVSGINYLGFLNIIKENLYVLLKYDAKFAKITASNNKLWSLNITYLISSNIQYIEKIEEKQSAKLGIGRQTFEYELNELQSQLNHGHGLHSVLYGFNLRDPFMLTNPDNVPFHLTSPCDDNKPYVPTFNKQGISKSVPQTGNDFMDAHGFSCVDQLQPQLMQKPPESSVMLVGDIDFQLTLENIWTGDNALYHYKSNSSLPQDEKDEKLAILQTSLLYPLNSNISG